MLSLCTVLYILSPSLPINFENAVFYFYSQVCNFICISTKLWSKRSCKFATLNLIQRFVTLLILLLLLYLFYKANFEWTIINMHVSTVARWRPEMRTRSLLKVVLEAELLNHVSVLSFSSRWLFKITNIFLRINMHE